MLYQLLTGQLPFQGDSTLEVLRAVTSDEPVRPRRLQPRLPRDLEAITLHCLEKEPARRYPSCPGAGRRPAAVPRRGSRSSARPVGRSPGWPARAGAGRWSRCCSSLLTVSLFVGLAGVTWKWMEANAQCATSQRQATQRPCSRRTGPGIAAAVAALSAHDVADAAGQLDAAPEELRNWEWRHLHSRLDDSSAVIALPAGEAGLFGAPDRSLCLGNDERRPACHGPGKRRDHNFAHRS